ncbi:hypothetical protein D9M72_520850 [compost metagenome]
MTPSPFLSRRLNMVSAALETSLALSEPLPSVSMRLKAFGLRPGSIVGRTSLTLARAASRSVPVLSLASFQALRASRKASRLAFISSALIWPSPLVSKVLKLSEIRAWNSASETFWSLSVSSRWIMRSPRCSGVIFSRAAKEGPAMPVTATESAVTVRIRILFGIMLPFDRVVPDRKDSR